MTFHIIHVHFDEYRDAEGFHTSAPNDGHDDIQQAVAHALDRGHDTLWVHHGYWPKGDVVEYAITPDNTEE